MSPLRRVGQQDRLFAGVELADLAFPEFVGGGHRRPGEWFHLIERLDVIRQRPDLREARRWQLARIQYGAVRGASRIRSLPAGDPPAD